MDLSENDFSDIEPLENEYFKNLKELNISRSRTKISNLKVLENCNFVKLEKLLLCDLLISDLSFLKGCNFKGLKELYLSYNYIYYNDELENIEFENLEVLSLNNNRTLSNLSGLKKVKCENLKVLDLERNELSDITVFKEVNFK